MIEIRPARVEDAAAILALNASFDDIRTTVEQIAQHIAHYAVFETPFVAEEDGVVIGMACLRLLPCLCDAFPYAELTELIVNPAYRRRGVGRALVGKIEQQAREQGAAALHINAAEHNHTAQTFYQTLGYQQYTVTLQRPLRDED